MPVVHLPDGRVVHFPDGMTPEQISHELEAIHAPAKSNTGMSTPDLQAANLKGRTDLPSTSGFVSNLGSSSLKLAEDTVSGIPSLLKMAGGAVRAAVDPQYRTQQATQIGEMAPIALKALIEGAKKRYGGVDQTLSTAYHDPAGMAADASTLAGGVGLAADAANAPKLAKFAGAASDAMNPFQVMKPIAKAVEYGTAGAIRPMLKPSKALKLQQDAPLEIERTALTKGAFTEGIARAKKNAAYNRATEAAAGATTTTPRGSITAMPKTLDDIGNGLSHESDLNTLAQVEGDAMRSLPPDVDASKMLKTRRYLDRTLNKAFRAEERGGAVTGVKEAGQQEMLGNVRRELRTAAPDIRAADDEARRLGTTQKAISEAGMRAGDIPMGAALLGGGLLAGGIPGAGLFGGGFALGRNFPQVPLALGSVPVRATAAAATPLAQKSGLLAALIERLNSGGQ